MNLANKLTLLRIFLVPFLILFLYINDFTTRVLALFIFTIATITDIYDGRIARRQNTVTTLGIFLDPLADKLIISAALISFVGMRDLNVPAWMVILIISREFIITGLRSIAATQNIIIPAKTSGKFKTTSQVVCIITIIVILIIKSALWEYYHIMPQDLFARAGIWPTMAWFLLKAPYWITFVTTVTTLSSGVAYMHAHKELLKQ